MADLIKKARDDRAKQIERQKRKGLIERNCNYGHHVPNEKIPVHTIKSGKFFVCLYCDCSVYNGISPLKLDV